MANENEKNYLEELKDTADIVETPYETEEEVTIIDDSLLDEGIIFKKVTLSKPQPDGTVKTIIEKRYSRDKFVRCFDCKRLLPRAKAGLFNRRYYCKKDFPYRRYYFKRFFGFFTGKGEENERRTEREVTEAGSIGESNRSGNESGSQKNGEEFIHKIQ